MAKYGMEQIGAPDFRVGKDCKVQLRQRNVAAGYLLKMAFAAVVTGGTGAGTFYADWWARFLRKITVKANGSEKQIYSGQFLAAYLRVFGNNGYTQSAAPTTAAGTKELEAHILIPQQMLWALAQQQEQFGLPTGVVENPELILTTGNAADLHDTDVDGAVAIQDGGFELYEFPYLDPTLAPVHFQAVEILDEEVPVTQSGVLKVQLKSVLPGAELRAVFIEALTGGSGGAGLEYDNALVDDLRLVINGRPVVDRVPFGVLQQVNKDDYEIADIAELTGLAIIDAAEDKNVGSLIRDAQGRPVGIEGELYRIQGREPPYLDMNVTKQAGECLVRITSVFVNRG